MMNDITPVVTHDDGIFSYSKKLEFGQTPVAESAREVIEAYRRKEVERIAKLKSPVTKIKGIPEELVMKQMNERAVSWLRLGPHLQQK